ncbi:hypothetical protein BpHYR1_022217 [Brachionus plicatilis]|uniref:Uncharacterized protein n=1 Tax=Brachionus plicatilis TaxID=10195 RepID=A0A3M7Q6C3_BRAPC|nr:hypothetical protein BpHYR1_022217 [Brachionus plicatilis]
MKTFKIREYMCVTNKLLALNLELKEKKLGETTTKKNFGNSTLSSDAVFDPKFVICIYENLIKPFFKRDGQNLQKFLNKITAKIQLYSRNKGLKITDIFEKLWKDIGVADSLEDDKKRQQRCSLEFKNDVLKHVQGHKNQSETGRFFNFFILE